jgi:alginate O-acetyltransferase complex protein AlgI
LIFNSWVFVVFFLGVYWAYVRLDHLRQNRLLLVASCLFYGYSDARFLVLVVLSAGLDYACSHRIAGSVSAAERTWFLRLAICGNLTILGFFKYYDFFIGSVAAAGRCLGLEPHVTLLNLALPAGISFYTFQSMSYTIDVYRGHTKPCSDALDFAIAVMFFPHLVAGPIQRAGNLIAQVSRPRCITIDDLRSGLWLLIRGYFLKVVVADNAAYMTDGIFSLPAPSGGRALLGVYAFALQIYGDFAGYSSIARGLARLMGFDLMVNFRQPYLALGPSDFWQRWHISLSGWLRDYLYVPLGGNRAGLTRTCRNLVLTMVLGGLWHGAAGKFVLWGLYHGLLLVAFRMGSMAGFCLDRLPRFLRIFGFFQLTCLGWLIFRCDTLNQIVEFPRAIFVNFAWGTPETHALYALCFLAAPVLVMDLVAEWADAPDSLPGPVVAACKGSAFLTRIAPLAYGAFGLLLCELVYFFGVRGGSPFIYFRF